MDEKKQELNDFLLSLARKYRLSVSELKNLVAEVAQELKSGSNVPRSAQIKVGWYAFEGGKFSSDPEAYPNLQGVVAWLNPDPNAPIGKRGLILMPDEVKLIWATDYYDTGIDDEEDGQANTRKLIAYSIAHGQKNRMRFRAAEWCYAYYNDGVKPGDGFLPAKNQLKRIVDNLDIVNPALEEIGGKILKHWIWSSSEYTGNSAWYVSASNGRVGSDVRDNYYYVRCVIAF